jgi:hypothetical protein
MYKIITKKQIIITNKQKSQVIVSLLNIIAHYRHYYSSLRCNNSVLLYCDDPKAYDNYKDIIEDLNQIVQFLPNVILVPKITTKSSRYFYLYTAAYVIEHTKRTTENNKQELIINVLGNNPSEYQFLTITEKAYCLPVHQLDDEYKICDYHKIWEMLIGKDERINNPLYQLGLKALLIPYCILYKKIEINKVFTSILSSRTTTRTNGMFTLLDGGISTDFVRKFAEISLSETSEVRSFVKIVEGVNYKTNPDIKPFIRDFVKTWSKKLKDQKIQSINDYIQSFSEANLQISWLLEDKGI